MADGWDEQESGFIDNYTGTIVDAQFGIDANYSPDVWQLFLVFEDLKDVDFDGAIPESLTQSYPVGKGWVSYDGGETIEDPNRAGRNKFNASSWYGIMLNNCGGAGLVPTLRSRGAPTEAKVWKDLTVRMAAVEHDFGGQIGKKSRPMPVQLIGTNGGVSHAAPAAQATPQAAQPESAAQGSLLTEIDAALAEELVKARAESASHSDFVDKAVALTGVAGNSKLVQAIADENQLYKELENS